MKSRSGPAIRKLAIAVKPVGSPRAGGGVGTPINPIAPPTRAKPKDVSKVSAVGSVSVSEPPPNRLRRQHRQRTLLRHQQLTLLGRARASAQGAPTPISRESRVADLGVMCFSSPGTRSRSSVFAVPCAVELCVAWRIAKNAFTIDVSVVRAGVRPPSVVPPTRPEDVFGIFYTSPKP
ncbi:MAG: hypothetical protein WAL71_03220 [Terriglobales bacterium]